jgi:hypothetical protein
MKIRNIKNDDLIQNIKEDSKEIITVKSNTKLLHPLTCNWIDTSTDKYDVCLTKYNYNDNFEFVKFNKACEKETGSKYKDFLYVPPVGLSSDVILKLYNITSFDLLDEWLSVNLENRTNIFTINRILNCWINNNITILRKHNKFLIDIYNKLLSLIIDKNLFSKIINLNDETLNYIDYWLNKTKDPFHLDLLYDYINYIQKKYKNK